MMGLNLGIGNETEQKREVIFRMILGFAVDLQKMMHPKLSMAEVKKHVLKMKQSINTLNTSVIKQLQHINVPMDTINRALRICRHSAELNTTMKGTSDAVSYWLLAFVLKESSRLANDIIRGMPTSLHLPLLESKSRTKITEESQIDPPLRPVQVLERAVEAISIVWKHWTENVYTDHLVRVFRKGRITFFETDSMLKHAYTGEYIFKAIDASLFENEAQMRMYLNINAGNDLFCFFGDLIWTILKSISSKVEVVCKPTGPLHNTCISIINGAHVEAQPVFHVLIRVTSPGGEQFAIDLSGVQHGWDQVIIPWEQYMATRGGTHRIQFFKRPDDLGLGFMLMDPYYQSRLPVRDHLNPRLLPWLTEPVGSAISEDFKQLSSTVFENKMWSFDRFVRNAIHDALEEIKCQEKYHFYMVLKGLKLIPRITSSKEMVRYWRKTWLTEAEWNSCKVGDAIDEIKLKEMWHQKKRVADGKGPDEPSEDETSVSSFPDQPITIVNYETNTVTPGNIFSLFKRD